MQEEPKPCPFCGGYASFVFTEGDRSESAWISCFSFDKDMNVCHTKFHEITLEKDEMEIVKYDSLLHLALWWNRRQNVTG